MKKTLKKYKYPYGGMTPEEKKNTTDGLGALGTSYYTSQMANPNNTQGDNVYNASMASVSNIGPMGKAIGGISAIGDSIGAPIKANAERLDENGNLINRNDAIVGHAAGSLLNPYKSLTNVLSDKNASKDRKFVNVITGGAGDVFYGNQYADNLQKSAQANMLPYGGVSGPNAEVEKQENTLNPDGSTTQYNGPSHSQGGIPTQLDHGTLVFSDRLKLGGKTFADLNKPFNTKKEDKVLNSEASSVAKTSAELMKMAKNKQSLALFAAQEELKAKKMGAYASKLGVTNGQFAMGGLTKYGGGGPYENETTTVPGYTQPGFSLGDPSQYIDPRLRSNATIDQELPQGSVKQDIWNSSLRTVPTTTTNTNSSGINWGQVGMAAAQNAGNLYDLYRANKKDKRTFNRVDPSLLDPTADLNNNTQVYNRSKESVRNASGGNASTYLNNIKDLSINKMITDTRIRQNYLNQNAAIKNQINMYNAGVGDRETIANAQIDANQRNIRANSIANMGQNSVGQYRDVKAEQRDADVLRMIAARYPEIMNDPEFAKYYNR